eukprot:366260-Chlamydomonas_euryale.AAC.42
MQIVPFIQEPWQRARRAENEAGLVGEGGMRMSLLRVDEGGTASCCPRSTTYAGLTSAAFASGEEAVHQETSGEEAVHQETSGEEAVHQETRLSIQSVVFTIGLH